jgi:hypothetical protein
VKNHVKKNRAWRRHKRAVKVAKAAKVIKSWSDQANCSSLSEDIAYRSVRQADNMAICSCLMCGNPRTWLKEKTLKEKSYSLRRECSFSFE